ncbi:HSP20-like chaperone [Lentithecium fluviatile CBS 122367]|uniref:HSP20-like chaperone n=1 Tax=Lentithecium fluviatile CBS 122367 TaxID=1168545 RepID=A0A6G1JJE1_9PLEO|nr:HSP20-like chaperone [Lentithecium fluviatile CBS 122367]
MAFFLTPRFAPAYASQQCNPWGCSPRPAQAPRRVPRPSFPSFVPFLSQVDELLSEIDREARREAHRQRQQRKRIARAHFIVHESKEAYQVDGEIAGFQQEHIDIEVTDDNTLKVSGDTERKAEQPQAASAPALEAPATEAPATEAPAQEETMDGVTLNEAERPASPVHSETGSHKSYQATVEDDFEDIGAEFATPSSTSSDTPAEPKGKEKAVDEPAANTETAVQQPQPEIPAQQSETDEWRFQGSFERTFRFSERIDATGVRASLRNGLLSITVPKAKAPEVRRITIQ